MQTPVLTTSASQVDERINFLAKTYGMLALCIGAGSIGAWASMGIAFPYEHPWMMLFAMIGGIFLVQAVRHIPVVNFAALLGFGALTGMAIAPLVAYASGKSDTVVTQAFMTTAITFVSLSAYVVISRKDFSFMRSFLITGLIALIVLMLLNYFLFESGVFSLALSAAAVLLFCGFILYDTSEILRTYPNNEYIAAALTLYIDVFMLFQHLLHLLTSLGDD